MEISLKILRSKEKRKSLEVQPSVPSFEPHYNFNADSPRILTDNTSSFVKEFRSLPEVAFPIIYITSRMKNARIVLKRYSDDSDVWATDKLYGEEALLAKSIRNLLEHPNYHQSFNAFTEQYFMQRYLTGNSFVFAQGVTTGKDIWRYAEGLHVIPSDSVQVVKNGVLNWYTAHSWRDIIKSYTVTGNGVAMSINPELVMFTRDMQELTANNEVKGESRLKPLSSCIKNLREVYEARFSIYNRGGALGAITSTNRDEAGAIPMTENDKKNIRDQFIQTYGVTGGRMPYAIVDVPISYVKFGGNINELQPFKETLVDATQIAAAFGVKKELMPRDDNSTFSNQESAEISCYNDMVIPEMNTYLDELSQFLGIKNVGDGYYLSADWSDVQIFAETQQRKKEAEAKNLDIELKKFQSGLVTMNDVLKSIGREPNANKLYDKTTIEMTPEERTVFGIK